MMFYITLVYIYICIYFRPYVVHVPLTRYAQRYSVATALGSRIPPHAVLLQVNDNTPVKLKIIFAI